MVPGEAASGLRAYSAGVPLAHLATAFFPRVAYLPLAPRGVVVSAMALLVALSTLGRCKVAGRDTQCHEVLLLDWRQ